MSQDVTFIDAVNLGANAENLSSQAVDVSGYTSVTLVVFANFPAGSGTIQLTLSSEWAAQPSGFKIESTQGEYAYFDKSPGGPVHVIGPLRLAGCNLKVSASWIPQPGSAGASLAVVGTLR